MARHCHVETQIHRLQRMLIILTIFVSSALGASFREEPSSKEVSIGDDVTLRCAVDGNLEGVSVFWWNINTARAFSDNDRISVSFLSVDQIERFSITGNSSIGEFYFTISDVKYADAGTYSCRMWDGTQWHFSQEVSLSVVRKTPACTLQANLPVDVGDIVRLSCRSYSNDPNVQLHWLSKGRLIQSLPNLSTNTLSVIQLTLTERDYDVPFMCLQATEDQRKACQLVPLHRQISVIVLNRITTAYEGDTATFQCTTGFSKDSLSFSWFVDDVLQPQSTASLEFTVTAQNNGSRITCKVQDSVSGIAGENDALLIVAPRPPTTTSAPTTKPILTKATTIADSKPRETPKLPPGLQSNSSKTESSTSRMITGTKSRPGTKSILDGNVPQETIVDSTTDIPPPAHVEIDYPKGGAGKSTPAGESNFMTAFIIGSLLIGLLLIVLIAVLLMFLTRQSRERRRHDVDGADEKAESNANGEMLPLGVVATEESIVSDDNARYEQTSPSSVKGKLGGIKETSMDYAILDPNNVDNDSMSDFRMSDEMLNGDLQDSKTHSDGIFRTLSTSTRDSFENTISAYAISNITPPSTLSNSPPLPKTARPSTKRSNSLQRPLPAEPKTPLLKSHSTPKRYTYMAPLEITPEFNDRTSLPVSPSHRMATLGEGEEDYAEISEMALRSSADKKQSSQQTTGELTRLVGDMSSTPSVESQEDSALGSGSSTEALALDECPYATISEEQLARNRQRLAKMTSAPASFGVDNGDPDDMVFVTIEDIKEAEEENAMQQQKAVAKKPKIPVYAKVDKSKKKPRIETPKSPKSPKSAKSPKSPKSLKSPMSPKSWQSWLESVVSSGSTDDKVTEEQSTEQPPAYATVWPHEQQKPVTS